MKTLLKIGLMAVCLAGLYACKNDRNTDSGFKWIVDRFDDVKVLRYQVPGFDSLELNDKLLVYYLSEAALCGRDILFDQNNRYNLRIRRTLEAIYAGYQGDRGTLEFQEFEKYLKKVWFANGIHHHYSTDKFTPGFSEKYFRELIQNSPKEYFPRDFEPLDAVIAEIIPVMFDPAVMPKRVNQDPEADLVVTSANNFYEGVTQQEVEEYYASRINPDDPRPVPYGLNSKMVKGPASIIRERTWRVDGMYSLALEKVVSWLEKAAAIANPTQKEVIETLINFYRTGNLSQFDNYSIKWVQDTISKVDFVNGFIETYGDPMGYRASWESIVNFRDDEATRRTEIISANAQWFEDNSPVAAEFKKAEVKGVSAKVITVAMLGGDCYPATPIGINLPNSDWIRKEYGSKSVTISNITNAYTESSKGNGFIEEFMLNKTDRQRYRKYGSLGDNLHTDLHECLGHGSGQLAPGVKGDELRNYASPLEESRADLFALYYLADPKLLELGLVPSEEVAKATYANYVMNGMMTQLTRIQPGKDIEQAHMRNRMMISRWCYEHGLEDNVIEKVVKDGKTYIVVNDFAKLRELFGTLLAEVQRIKSEGDYEAGRDLIETYGVKVDPALHREVLERYAKLNLEPYSGFINPSYNPVMEGGQIVDVKLEYETSYVDQMLRYSKEYSYLPSNN